MYSRTASPSSTAVKRWTAGAPALRYTRDADAVVRHTWLPAPRATEVSTTSPPTSPPVGLRSVMVAMPLPSRSTARSAWSGRVKRFSVSTVTGPRRAKTRRSRPSRPTRPRATDASVLEEEVVAHPVDHDVGAGAIAKVGENKRSASSHARGVPLHHAEVRADVRGEVDLVDDEQIGSHDAGPALARNLVSLGDVDHVDRRVHELGAERRREVVPSALHEEDLQIREPRDQLVHRLEIHGGVLADGRMRASARFHSDHPLGGQRAPAHQELSVLLRVDVVGDHGELVAIAKASGQGFDERRLPGADGPTDADLERAGRSRLGHHDRNSRASSRSWRAPSMSSAGVKLQRSAVSLCAASPANRSMSGCKSH